MDRYQPLHRRDPRPPPPSPPPMRERSESGRWRDGDGGERGRWREIDSEGATVSPWAESQGRYSNTYRGGGAGVWGGGAGSEGSYRGGARGGSYGDTDRGEPARYLRRENTRYENPGQGNANYNNEAPRGRSMPGLTRNSQGSLYSEPGASTACNDWASLQNQFGSVPGYGRSDRSNNRRNDQWRGQNLPPPPIGEYANSRNGHCGGQVPPLPPPPMERFRNTNAPLLTSNRGEPSYPSHQYPESGRPRPEGYRSRECSRGRAPFRDYSSAPLRRDARHRSEHRYPLPASSYSSPRGPLSSARFRQGIDKHSRYCPVPPSTLFHTSESLGKKTRGRGNGAERVNKANAPGRAPTGPRNPSPTLPPIPPLNNKLPVPKPSEIYLAKSLEISPRLSVAAVRRQLVILDLNGTLLVRKCGRAKSGSIYPTPRPGLAAFLQYIFMSFGVMVWSSAQPDNVRLMIHALFSPAQKSMLLGQWARDTLGLTKVEFGKKVQVYKRLERVWGGEYQISFPEVVEEGGNDVWDQTNTMLLDDSPIKALGQPYNHIEVPEFLGTAKEVKEDRALVGLVGYLEEIRWQGNVSAFIRSKPFKVGGKWQEVGKNILGGFGWVDKPEKVASEAEDEKKVDCGRNKVDRVVNPAGGAGGLTVSDGEGLESKEKVGKAKKLKKAKKTREIRGAERMQKREESKRAERAEKLEAIALSDIGGLGFGQKAEKLEAIYVSDHEAPEISGDSSQQAERVASS